MCTSWYDGTNNDGGNIMIHIAPANEIAAAAPNDSLVRTLCDDVVPLTDVTSSIRSADCRACWYWIDQD